MNDAEAKKSIIVVDDDPSIRDVINIALKEEGYDVIKSYDGRHALELTARRRFDLMFLDIRMPGFNGQDILILMKAARPEMPVVMLTAVIDPEVESYCLQQGASAFLRKPCDLQDVVNAAKNVLLERKPEEAFDIEQSFQDDVPDEFEFEFSICDVM
jgi:DNA-binding NtrC family response regulator